MQSLKLKPGREKSILRRHPWVYSGAVAQAPVVNRLGDTLPIYDASDNFLAWAAVNPKSQIMARVWSWNQDEVIDDTFFNHRLQSAIDHRQGFNKSLPGFDTNAMRLVHGESDGIPGLIVDRYADVLVFQLLTAGVERWKEVLTQNASAITGVSTIFERSDVDVRNLEGLEERVGFLKGSELPERVVINENGLQFLVDIRMGHKTGFYLDQRLNRYFVRSLAGGREVLDCFCYTGGFTSAAAFGGAGSVLSVDASAEVLEGAALNLKLNGLDSTRVELRQADVFKFLREMRDRGRTFDMIILDPPKFAQTTAQVARAARGYKDINLLAFKLLRPGGLLVTFSCSGGVDENLFQKIVAGAALDAGVEARILQRLSQGPDHPVALNFPEGAYLKGFIIQVS